MTHGFIADYDELDEVPVCPLGELSYLGLGAGDSSLIGADEDAEDELELDVFVGGGVSDVLESATVGAVDSDDGESLGLDLDEIGPDGIGGLAGSLLVIWCVGETPLVT